MARRTPRPSPSCSRRPWSSSCSARRLHDDSPAPAEAAGRADRVDAASTPAAPKLYRVRAGDTLATISAATGVSVARLEQLNPNVEPTSLFIGDRIRLR